MKLSILILLALITGLTDVMMSQNPVFQWKYATDGKSYYEDRGVLNEFDASGNLIVAGYGDEGCTSIDIMVVKYSSTGDTLWKLTFDGSGTYGQDDYPHAMRIDPAGNIFITGITGNNSFSYALTLKIGPSGNLLWSQRYLTAESSGNDIAIDGAGNVLVCGMRKVSGNKDYLLIKYNAQGNQQWIQNYSNGNHDEALSLDLDNNNNIYVTGRQSGVNPFYDWATLKYDASGNQQWVDVFASSVATWTEEPVKLISDPTGFIYVSGFVPISGPSNRDYYLIKYDLSGNRVWETAFNNNPFSGDDQPVDMMIDPNSNIYLTGNCIQSMTGQDIVTVKFSASGQFLWKHSIDSIQMTDYGRSIAYDALSNSIFIIGDITVNPSNSIARDWIVVKLDTAGNEISETTLNGPGNEFDLPYDLSVSPSGKLAVTGMITMNTIGNGDIGSVCYDSLLLPLWTRYHNGDGFADDHGTEMVLDQSGNAYVCGYTRGGDITLEDMMVFKVDTSGLPVWRYDYAGTVESSSDKALAITVDAQQNVYITGSVDTSGGNNYRDIYTAKISSTGQLLWQNIYSGTAGGADYPVAIAVLPNGNVMVAANTVNTGTNADASLICYSNTGLQQWVTDYHNGGQAELFHTMAVNSQNEIYCAGASHPANGALSDGLLVKFDPAGIILWDTTYDFSAGSVSDRDFYNSIALDQAGNVFVAGQAAANFVTAKYLPSGNPEWIQNYSHSSFADSACAIAIDPVGNVLVGGTMGQPVEADFGVVKYRNDGTLVWDRRYTNSPGSDDIVNDIVTDAAGNSYLSGWETASFSTNYNFMILKYDSSGTFKYEIIWSDSLGVGPDYGKQIALDNTGNLYIMGDANENCFGNVFVNDFRWNAMVMRYGQDITSGLGEISSASEEMTIFPNPAEDHIFLTLPENVFGNRPVNVYLYNVQGQLVEAFTSNVQETLRIETGSLPKGLYFFRAQNENGSRQSKIVVR